MNDPIAEGFELNTVSVGSSTISIFQLVDLIGPIVGFLVCWIGQARFSERYLA